MFDHAGADPYCKVTCEGTTVLTPICKDTLEPKFNSDVVFYVKKPAEAEVKIQVSDLMHIMQLV